MSCEAIRKSSYEEISNMKKIVALLLAALMLLGCAALAENIHMDKLTFDGL